MICKARSARPIVLIQWWILPGPSRPWAISNPLPSPVRKKGEQPLSFVIYTDPEEIMNYPQ